MLHSRMRATCSCLFYRRSLVGSYRFVVRVVLTICGMDHPGGQVTATESATMERLNERRSKDEKFMDELVRVGGYTHRKALEILMGLPPRKEDCNVA